MKNICGDCKYFVPLLPLRNEGYCKILRKYVRPNQEACEKFEEGWVTKEISNNLMDAFIIITCDRGAFVSVEYKNPSTRERVIEEMRKMGVQV